MLWFSDSVCKNILLQECIQYRYMHLGREIGTVHENTIEETEML